MPDLETQLTRLRASLRDSVPTPAIEDVIERAHRRTTRRRVVMGAALAVVAITASIPLLLRSGTSQDTAVLPAPSAPNTWVFAIDFFDANHGFAITTACAKDSDTPCTRRLLVTEDGTTWASRNLPVPKAAHRDLDSQVVALGPRALMVDLLQPNSSTRRWFSDDGGRIWREVSGAIEGTVEEIPDAASLALKSWAVEIDSTVCKDGVVAVVLPDSGRTVKLANQPALKVASCQPFPDAEGTWWVSGTATGSDQVAVASSRDRGRNWRVSVLPAFQPPPEDQRHAPEYPKVKVTASGSGTVYATVINPTRQLLDGLITVNRSTDGGATWTRTWQAADGRKPEGLSGSPVTGTDGMYHVIAHQETNLVWTSADGGRTFTSEPTVSGYTRWTRAGYLTIRISPSENAALYSLSKDGVHWQPIKIPL